jgi:hypothetical protein
MSCSLRRLVLVVSLSLAAVSIGAPTALACGGYGPPVTAEDRAAITDAVVRHFFVRYGDPMPSVASVEMYAAGAAYAWIMFDDGSPSVAVTLHVTESGWRVTGE